MFLFSDKNNLLYQKSNSGFGKSSGEVVTKKIVKVMRVCHKSMTHPFSIY